MKVFFFFFFFFSVRMRWKRKKMCKPDKLIHWSPWISHWKTNSYTFYLMLLNHNIKVIIIIYIIIKNYFTTIVIFTNLMVMGTIFKLLLWQLIAHHIYTTQWQKRYNHPVIIIIFLIIEFSPYTILMLILIQNFWYLSLWQLIIVTA